MSDLRLNRIAKQELGVFLSDIASTEPSPGAGAASGAALALATALARKALLMTLKHRPEQRELAGASDRLGAIGEEALALADEDAARFAAMLSARQHGEPNEGYDADKQAAALDDLCRRMLALCDETTAIAREMRDLINTNMANDLMAAVSLTGSAAAIQRANASELSAKRPSGSSHRHASSSA